MPIDNDDLSQNAESIIEAHRRKRPEGPPDSDELVSCSCCLHDLPLTKEFFDYDAHRPNGFRGVCKKCRSENHKKKRDTQVKEKLEALDTQAMGAMQALVEGGSDVPHVAEVFQRIMEGFEGVGGFAKHFLGTYLAAKPGSTTRQKMIDSVLRLAAKVSESGASQIPVDLLGDEDLQQELERRARKLLLFTDPDDSSEGTLNVKPGGIEEAS